MKNITSAITKTYSNWGAQLKITLKGEPAAIERETNLLMNFGAANSLPDDYDPKTGSVTFPVTKTKLLSALRGIAENELASKSRRAKRKGGISSEAVNGAIYGYNAKATIESHAASLFATFEKSENWTNNSRAGISSVRVSIGEQV
jgi:hypothetical protein